MHRIINISMLWLSDLFDKFYFSFWKLSSYIIVTLTFLVYSIFDNTVTFYTILFIINI